MARDLCSLNLLAKLMVLRHQILFSLAIAAIVEAILMRISAEQMPSFQWAAPMHLTPVNFSHFWPFMLTSAMMLHVLLVMILLFSMLTSIP